MPLRKEQITRLDVWNRFRCPVCEGTEFVSLHGASAWCDECNAQFQVRHTAGDPGYVVDCFTKHCTAYYKDEKRDYRKIAKEKIPEGYAYLIDKEHGDYSGWIISCPEKAIAYLHQDTEQKIAEHIREGNIVSMETIKGTCKIYFSEEHKAVVEISGREKHAGYLYDLFRDEYPKFLFKYSSLVFL